MFSKILSNGGAALALVLGLLGPAATAQQPAAGSRFDVTNYHIEAQLNPNEHALRAGADLIFVPLDPTGSTHDRARHYDGLLGREHLPDGLVEDENMPGVFNTPCSKCGDAQTPLHPRTADRSALAG